MFNNYLGGPVRLLRFGLLFIFVLISSRYYRLTDCVNCDNCVQHTHNKWMPMLDLMTIHFDEKKNFPTGWLNGCDRYFDISINISLFFLFFSFVVASLSFFFFKFFLLSFSMWRIKRWLRFLLIEQPHTAYNKKNVSTENCYFFSLLLFERLYTAEISDLMRYEIKCEWGKRINCQIPKMDGKLIKSFPIDIFKSCCICTNNIKKKKFLLGTLFSLFPCQKEKKNSGSTYDSTG